MVSAKGHADDSGFVGVGAVASAVLARVLTGYTHDFVPKPLHSPHLLHRQSPHRPLLVLLHLPRRWVRPDLASAEPWVGDQPYPQPAVALSLAEGSG